MRSCFNWFSAVLTLACFATGAQAASVGPSGYTNAFNTQPPLADWSTLAPAGGNTTYGTTADIDAAMATLGAETINTGLVADAVNPPASIGNGTWCSSGFFVQTRPTAVAGTILMCTLVNNVGGNASSVTISYDFAKVAILGEEVDGHRAYYSVSGAAGSWTPIPEFSNAAAGRLSATLNFNWANAGTLYIAWVDDNSVAASPDTAMQIDNFSARATPAPLVPVAITADPQSQTVAESTPTTFTVGATGNPSPTFQWFKNNAPLSGATNTTYSIAHTPLSDNGKQFYVIAANTVSNVNYAATSAVAVLTVNADTNPPVANYQPSPGSILAGLNFINVVFDKSVTGVEASDLLIEGVAASSVTTNNPNDFSFSFPQPPTGTVHVAWALTHGITDTTPLANAFQGGNWTYSLDPGLANSRRILISEFLSDNNAGIKDDDGARSDWLELLNTGLLPAALDGWFLTDTPTDLTKWQFPQGLAPVQPNQYLLVWASQKNHTNPLAPLHTSFKISKDPGHYLALVSPETNVISVFDNYPVQQSDISYGRDFSNPDLVGYYTTPTPGSANSTRGPGFMLDPVFSLASGVYTNNSLSLTISNLNGTGTIRYTTDRSLPTTTSLLYSAPITVAANMTIKARIFPPGTTNLFPSAVVGRNFVLLDSTVTSFTSKLPTVIISTEGQSIVSDVVSGGARTKGSFVVIDTTYGRSAVGDQSQVHELAEFEIFGQTSAGFAKRPIRVEIQDSIGNDLDKEMLGMPADSDWRLRNPYNDKTLLNDFLGFELWEKMGHYSVRRRLVEVFVDTTGAKLVYPGDYYGVMVLTETIKANKDRLDIAKMSPYATNEPAITGGYVFALDKDSPGDLNFVSPGNGGGSVLLKMHEPKATELRTVNTTTITTFPTSGSYTVAGSNQMTWLRKWIGLMETALFSATWTTQTGTNHYSYYMDLDRFADQILHVEITKQIDGYRLSDYFSKDRLGKVGPGPVWDWNLAFGNANYAEGGQTNTWYYDQQSDGSHPWGHRLVTGNGDPNFVQLVADRWAMFRTNVLNGTNLLAEIDELATLLGEAAARDLYGKYRANLIGRYTWPNPDGGVIDGTGSIGGIQGRDADYCRPTNYFGPIETVAPASFSGSIIGQMKKWMLGRYLWMDSQFTQVPTFSAGNGMVTNGFTVTVTPPAGSVLYYRLDGTDPRASGGSIVSGTLSNNASVTVTVNANMRIVARAKTATGWKNTFSGANALSLYSSIPALRITELMYHPFPPPPGSLYDTEDFEYLEVKNIGATPLNVNRFTLSGGVQFNFPNTILSAGQRAVVVANVAAFQSRYGTNNPNILILGAFTGHLDNAGDHLVLAGSAAEPILDFKYKDGWYPATDGLGFSLVTVDENAPTSAWGLSSNWRASSEIPPNFGSPGQNEAALPLPAAIVINEALTHSDTNLTPGLIDYIELYNPTASPVDISGWFLTDDFFTPQKYRIPAGDPRSVIPVLGYAVFTEADFNAAGSPNALIPFALRADGDEVYVFSGNGTALTGHAHGFDFGAQANGVTFGRHVISTGNDHFVAQVSRTSGGTNAGPLVGPIVISTINYHPPDIITNGGSFNNLVDEYIQLQNSSASPVPLYDPAYPTNTWRLRDAVNYTFPTNTTILAGGKAMVVSFDPADPVAAARFRADNQVPPTTTLFGPFHGQLDNSGDSIELVRPDQPRPLYAPDAGSVYYILVDKVNYSDEAPWPTIGAGAFLTRRSLTAYGNDPANWFAPLGITSHPQSQNVRLTDGASAGPTVLFNVTASGSNPIGYQWRFNGTDIPGANGPVLVLNNVNLGSTGDYSVVASNSVNSSTSRVARLNVYTDFVWRFASVTGNIGSSSNALGTNLLIFLQTAGETYVDDISLVPLSGPYAGINVITNGDFEAPLTGPWVIPAGMSGSVITNTYAHSGNYSLHVVSTSAGSVANSIKQALPPSSTNIFCTLSFWFHSLPNSANLTVRTIGGSFLVVTTNTLPTDMAPGIASQPRNLAIPTGAGANFTVTPFGSEPFTYEWFKDSDKLVDGGKIAGAGTAALTISNAQDSELGNYSVKVGNAVGFISSAAATLTLLAAPPAITLQPQSQHAPCHGSVTFTVAASGSAPLTYQWRSNLTAIVNATNVSLTLTNLAASAAGPYSVVVTNSLGSTNSSAAILVVDDLTTLTSRIEGSNLVVTWLRPCAALQLEETGTLSSPNWTLVNISAQETATEKTVTIPLTTTNRFYRLRN